MESNDCLRPEGTWRQKAKKISLRRQSASRVIKSELDFMRTNSSAFT